MWQVGQARVKGEENTNVIVIKYGRNDQKRLVDSKSFAVIFKCLQISIEVVILFYMWVAVSKSY